MSARKWWRIVDAEGAPSIISTPANKRPGDCGYDEKTLSSIVQCAREPGEFDDVDPATGAVRSNIPRKAAAERQAALAGLSRAELADLIQDTVAELVADALSEMVPGVTVTPAQRDLLRAKATIDPSRLRGRPDPLLPVANQGKSPAKE